MWISRFLYELNRDSVERKILIKVEQTFGREFSIKILNLNIRGQLKQLDHELKISRT